MCNFLQNQKTIIGMIHIDALPGTPGYNGDMKQIIRKTQQEAVTYKEAGIDALMIENMHDVPYARNIGPEITSAMAVLGHEVKQVTGLRCGIQILAAANIQALGTAAAAGMDFIRVEGFVFGHIADEGYIDGCAAEILRYRKQIGAENILVLTDIKKKHSSHAITADMDIVETARAAEFFLSDGVIVTGSATGREASPDELTMVKDAVNIPVLVGSGVNEANVDRYLALADALIVGSAFKVDGKWTNRVDSERVSAFMKRVNAIR
jgi:membrane complex biogenesis BtpA family protein